MKINVTGEKVIQSPHVYLQSAGSTGNDGTVEGYHLRWAFLNTLGENHLPKGNNSTTNHLFNRNDDFVRVYKVPYNTKFQTIINVAETIPSKVISRNDKRIWVYVTENLTPIYLHFKDVNAYDAITVNPLTNPTNFLTEYGEGLLEVEAKDELFFAAEIEIENELETTIIKTEAISKRENTPLGEKFISCRKTYNALDIIDAQAKSGDDLLIAENEDFIQTEALEGILINEGGFIGSNLLKNPGFEEGSIGFETDYIDGANFSGPGYFAITGNASLHGGSWQGKPFRGSKFMVVDGSTSADQVVWKQRNIPVRVNKDFTFEGWFTNLIAVFPAELNLHVQLEQTNEVLVFTLDMNGFPAAKWINLKETFNVGNNTSVTIWITNSELAFGGNDFGIDSLAFYESTFSPFSGIRVQAENMTSVRFTVKDANLLKIKVETYKDFYEGINEASFWTNLGAYSLSINNQIVFDALEKISDFTINGTWPKYNQGAFVKTQNYIDKWNVEGGLKTGVENFIALSNDTIANPRGLDLLPEDGGLQNDAIKVSYLDLLNIASVDYHVARMLGLGTIDSNTTELDENQYVFLMHYVTEADLEDGNGARRVEHFFMTPPTSKLNDKLPYGVNLKEVAYGLEVSNGSDKPITITQLDENGNHTGYTLDHKARYIKLFAEESEFETALGEFYESPVEFCLGNKTEAVMMGIEYKLFGDSWVNPELLHEANYTDTEGFGETILLPIRDDNNPVYIHKETNPGIHVYSSYGVNWFSRASELGNSVATDFTEFVSENTLIPPTQFKVQFIQKESPRYFTTLSEQNLLEANIYNDKTLVRVTFNYNHLHDGAYGYYNRNTLNWEFGDTVELFFRRTKPRSVKGAVKDLIVNDDDFFTITTRAFTQTSNGETISPEMDVALYGNYEGGVLVIGEEKYIIADILVGGTNEGPQFKLYIQKQKTPLNETTNTVVYKNIIPQNVIGSYFTAIENMASANNWHEGSTSNGTLPQKLSATIQIGDNWLPVEEVIEINPEGETETKTLRGIWDNNATITVQYETVDDPENPGQTINKHLGVYKIEFSLTLNQHPQSGNTNPVFWEGGVIRVPQIIESDGANPVFDKIPLEVIKIENVGTNDNLIVYAYNPAFDGEGVEDNQVKTGIGFKVNYYPGYKMYLYVDNTANFNEFSILPSQDEGIRSTYLAVRSKSIGQNYTSNLSPAQIIFARELTEPGIPQMPLGPLYATRPDFYDKSTYTFTVEFDKKPFSVVFFRANERSILSALYEQDTIYAILNQLPHRTKDEFYTSRWRNLLEFFDDPENPPVGSNTFGVFNDFSFPNPDKKSLFENEEDAGTIEVGNSSLYLKARTDLILAFTPICEQAILWEFIKGNDYNPVNKKQVFRDSEGNVLPPTHPDFDPAPMVKKLNDALYKLQFTDFTLEGSADEAYFYLGREISSQMKMGEISPIAGPIQLINTTPATEPKIVKVTTQLSDVVNGVNPSIIFELTAYPEFEKIAGFAIYRTNLVNNTLSPRSMELVKTILLSDEELFEIEDNIIKIKDDFEGEEFLPYGEPLFYRIVALREVEYLDNDILVTELAPSKPSKLLIANLVDEFNPLPPNLKITGEISVDEQLYENVKLSWKKTVHNGIYRIYKMNEIGNWEKLGEINRDNNSVLEFNLNNALDRFDEDENKIYHRFKVDVENSSGLLNLTENVITVVTGANDLLEQMLDFIEITDEHHSFIPESSMFIDPSFENPGTITITDKFGEMILGHTFDKIEVTIEDSLENSVTKLLPQNGSVTFNQLDGIQVDDSILNITYNLKIKVFTDLAPNGVLFNYVLNYGPINALMNLQNIVDFVDGNNVAISPLISESVDELYPTSLTFTNIVEVPNGQLFDYLDIELTDGLGNVFNKPINSINGSVTFVNGEGDLVLNEDNTNGFFTINITLYTDKCPDGFLYQYELNYIGEEEEN